MELKKNPIIFRDCHHRIITELFIDVHLTHRNSKIFERDLLFSKKHKRINALIRTKNLYHINCLNSKINLYLSIIISIQKKNRES